MEIKSPQIMYDYMRNKPKKVIDHISPSALGGCMRAHFYEIKHIPQTTPPNPGALLNFQVGFLWEQVMENALIDAKIEHKYQWELEDKELNLKGTLDFAIHDKTTDEWEVWDTKTESILAKAYLKRSKETYLEAHERYVIQVGTYILMLRRMGYNVSRGRLVVITKDNGFIEEHYVTYTPELEEKILNRINKLNQHLKDNTLPECECWNEGAIWIGQYCSYGQVETQKPNAKGKIVNTSCCSENLFKEIK